MHERQGHSERLRAVAALTLVQLFFGLHYFATKLVLAEIAPRAWAALRAGGAAAVLVVAALVLRRLPRLAGGDYARLALFSVFGVMLNQLLFIEGMSRTTATHASILITGIPVGTLLFAVLLGRERLAGLKLAALAVSTAGVVLVVSVKTGGGAEGAGPSLAGDLMVLTNALSYAFFLVISKRLLSRVEPLPATAVLMTFGALGLLLIGSGELARFDPGAVSSGVWTLAAFIAVFPTALGYLMNYYALKRLNASVVGLFIYLQPLIASALAIALLGERLEQRAILGAVLIFTGVHLSLRR